MEKKEFLGKYTLTQSDECFKYGQDSYCLYEFATVRPGFRVCDLGCGIGTLLLGLAQREPSIRMYGIDLHGPSVALARRNLSDNGLAGTIVQGDLREKPFDADVFDLVISNPPYFTVSGGMSAGPARSEENCTLDELCEAAARLCKSGGRFALCHRPERLAPLLETLRAHRLEPKRMQFVQHDADASPSVVLTETIRNGREGLTVLPTRLILS